MVLHLKISNMVCGACGKTITKSIQSIDPTAGVQVDPKTKQVTVETQASESSVRDAIAAAGYPAD